jgi:hypothetical protein
VGDNMFYVEDGFLKSDQPIEPKTLKEAFDLSIEAWQTRLQYHLDHPNSNEAISCHSPGNLYIGDFKLCGLCVFFNTDCERCPIGISTFPRRACGKTPYVNYHDSNANSNLIKHAQQEIEMLAELKSKYCNTR